MYADFKDYYTNSGNLLAKERHVTQIYLNKEYAYEEIYHILESNNYKNIFLVSIKSLEKLPINNLIKKLSAENGIRFQLFTDFKPNPESDSVVKGNRIFHEKACDFIIAVGGGSAIDVAKCIKLDNTVPLLAIPTTSGSGSEATKFAVIYQDGVKQSISHENCIPEYVLLDPAVLKTLPLYQKTAAMLDALCHGIESYWSVNSNDDSKIHSRKSIELILSCYRDYLKNTDKGNSTMMYAANLAGKAINVTQTTAAHAMCYKLTTLYGIPHGYAAALCLTKLWKHMTEHLEQCQDKRGMGYLNRTFKELAELFKCQTVKDAVNSLESLICSLGMENPAAGRYSDIKLLVQEVNPIRLGNNPIVLNECDLISIYEEIMKHNRS